MMQDQDETLEEPVDDVSSNHLKSLESVLADFSSPYAVETHVVHDQLQYHGYCDCVALYKKKRLVLVDWKTSQKKKLTLGVRLT